MKLRYIYAGLITLVVGLAVIAVGIGAILSNNPNSISWLGWPVFLMGLCVVMVGIYWMIIDGKEYKKYRDRIRE
jgi:hypothetical protein